MVWLFFAHSTLLTDFLFFWNPISTLGMVGVAQRF